MKIQCQVLDQLGADELEVDENFRLWPCCYVNSTNAKGRIDNFVNGFPDDWNSLDHHSWEEILEHPAYAVHFNEEHWNNPEQCSPICQRECSVEKTKYDGKHSGKNFQDILFGNKFVVNDGSSIQSNLQAQPVKNNRVLGWNDVPIIDFGITSHCNAACSGCNRTNNETRKAHEWLKLKHLDADNLIKCIFEAYKFFPSLKTIKFCGDRGDPMMHPDIEFLINTLCKEGQNLKINTNGSLRSPDFYEKIADYKNMTLTWSIDGFEETNHVYRYGCDFDKIWNNFTTFCKSGGGSNANWDFLVFKHNWHEIPRVKEEAIKLNINSLDFKIVQQGIHYGAYGIPIVESIENIEEVKKLINENTLSNT